MLYDLIRANRSYRRFFQDVVINKETLVNLVELARLSPSPKNKQMLKYILSCEKEKNELIFPQLAWAGYLNDWDGPELGEKPSAYIIVVSDMDISPGPEADLVQTAVGIAIQSILLGATELGLGGCIIASVKRQLLREVLKIDQRYDILCVLALGKPKEDVILDEVGVDGNIKYWRDDKKVHHVPKRKLKDIILNY
jgi:nitroreductase